MMNNSVDIKVNGCIEYVKWIESNYSKFFMSSSENTDYLLDYLNDEKRKINKKIKGLKELNSKISDLSNIIDDDINMKMFPLFFKVFDLSILVLEKDKEFVSKEFKKRKFGLQLLKDYSNEISDLKESISDLKDLIDDFEHPDEDLIKLF